jgi:ribosomal protein S18 acetylase RimI-like enzyme
MTEVVDIPKAKIACIRNLWEKLNEMHYEDSVFFEDHFASFTFEKRIEPILRIDDSSLKITIVKDGPKYLGYCISSFDGDRGEIESIYLDEEARGRGLGKELVERHKSWMKDRGCAVIRAGVSYGHDSATKFYHAMGFYERMTYFELKEDS